MTTLATTLETAIVRSRKLRPRTKELYLQHVRAFLEFAGNETENWTSDAVIAWCDDMRTRRIKSQSVNVALNALRYAAQRADCQLFINGIQRLPVRRHRTSAQAKAAERALSWEEGRKLVRACISPGTPPDGTRGRDLRDTAIITLGLRTGMLRFSMCQLRFEDITADGRLTFVKKGGERHTIMLDKVTHAALRAWINWLVAHGVEDGLVFRSLGRQRVDRDGAAIGDQLTPDGLYRALRMRAKKAKLSDLGPHVFRKTFLAWVKGAGAHPGQIAAVTGHKSDGVGDDNGVVTPPANMLLPKWRRKSLK